MSDAHLPRSRTLAELAVWQAGADEPALETDWPIIDAHHHMWERPTQQYGFAEWTLELRTGHDLRASVFVECSMAYRANGPEYLKPVGETEYVSAAARNGAGPQRLCAAIIGYADLTIGERLRETLEAHIAAGEGRFRGVRQQAQYDPVLGSLARRAPPQHLLRSEALHAGVRELVRLDLTLDVYAYFTQLDDVAELARAVPDATIVLNHTGTPLGIGPYAGKRDEVFAAWSNGIRALAQCPNVVVKLGGLGMPLCGFGFEAMQRPPNSEALARAWRPYIETCVEAFSAKRAMFESNFPVDKQSCTYAALWNAFKRIAAQYSEAERRSLFAVAAEHTYKLTL